MARSAVNPIPSIMALIPALVIVPEILQTVVAGRPDDPIVAADRSGYCGLFRRDTGNKGRQSLRKRLRILGSPVIHIAEIVLVGALQRVGTVPGAHRLVFDVANPAASRLPIFGMPGPDRNPADDRENNKIRIILSQTSFICASSTQKSIFIRLCSYTLIQQSTDFCLLLKSAYATSKVTSNALATS